MAEITMQMIKEIRELTGAGMTDCKKALSEAQGDMDKAIKILREKGLAAAAKKSARAASEGCVSALVSHDTKSGYVFEVNCETDFVTRNEIFISFVESLKNVIQKNNPDSLDALNDCDMDGVKVSESIKALIAKIGENINLRRFEKLDNKVTYVTSYVHGNGKIGVIVGLKASHIDSQRDSEDLKNIGKNVALQVAAMKPQYLDEDSVPKAVIDAESEVIKNKFLKQGKPEQALLKIIPGSIKKWMKEICLNAQDYVKDEGVSIKNYVQTSGNALGFEDLEISEFKYLELGQGVEKKSENFADEVAAQVASAQK